MRIAFMAYDKTNYHGGPIINARRILPELVKRGHQVHALIGYKNDFPNARFLRKQGVTCSIMENTYTENMIRWIIRELNHFQPDVFIPNISVAGGFAAKWAMKSDIATIICQRSPDLFNRGLAKMFGYGFKEWQTSGLMCVSNFLKEDVIKQTKIPVRIKVIPSGVPVPSEFTDQRESDTLKVIYAGRIEQKYKRIWDIVTALISASKKYGGMQFTLLGDGSEKNKIAEFIKSQNQEKIFLMKNNLLGDDYYAELRKNHVIVLLSDLEGMPGTVMEGMACGLVPVCLRINGIDELVQHGRTGFLANDRGDDFIGILEMLKGNHKLRKEISENARRHIIENYSLPVAVDRWEAFCQELTGKPVYPIKLPRNLRLPQSLPEISNEDNRKPGPLSHFTPYGVKRNAFKIKSWMYNRLVKNG
ncbi:MAG: glycosyltransferase [Desulfobacteraceae bacterium]|nr:MAG: glycosyltransferase [Desulfobacteraceae bacterium]